MSGFRRRAVGLGGALVGLLLGGIDPAYADGTLQHCLNQGLEHHAEPPTCTKVNGTWVPSWPGDAGSSGAGIPGAVVFFAGVAILIAIAVTVWKVSTARKLARQSGMDPGLATQMTLLTEDGLDATYLASNLRKHPVAGSGSSPVSQEGTPSDAAERLRELASLLDHGLVTRSEYDERRKAIIDTV